MQRNKCKKCLKKSEKYTVKKFKLKFSQSLVLIFSQNIVLQYEVSIKKKEKVIRNMLENKFKK
jgi:hypothetical protein